MTWKTNTLEEEALSEAILKTFQDIYQQHLAEEEFINHGLSFELRALRALETWRLGLLLTPWMLSRIYIPTVPPELPLPQGWENGSPEGDYEIIGPMLTFPLSGKEQKAHLHFSPEIGHFLIQPLVQSMARYHTNEEVFTAWQEVLARREEFLKKNDGKCPEQRGERQAMSRRGFLRKLLPQKS